MPNWCTNRMRIKGNKKVLENFLLATGVALKLNDSMDSQTMDFSLNALYPCPDELYDTRAGSFSDETAQAELEAKQQANIEKYGFKDWYDWCIKNWGTKWDVADSRLEEVYEYDEDMYQVLIQFDTAWSPPTAWFEYASNAFPSITFDVYFYEPGMGFEGVVTLVAGDIINSVSQNYIGF